VTSMPSSPLPDALGLAIDSRGIARVTLRRPDLHNAFDDALISALRELFETLAEAAPVRAVVLQAEGRSFSAGADIGYMQRMAGYSVAQNAADAENLARMLHALYGLPQPTIARVQGPAIGGGVGLVACCDIAIAASSARFALSEVRLGMIPATIGPYVVAAMGARAARRYFVTGERFDADRAAALGLVSEVVPDETLDKTIAALLDQIVAGGPVAVRAAKQLVHDVAGRPIDDSLILDTSARIATLRASAEGQEGLRAFLGKRPVQWPET